MRILHIGNVANNGYNNAKLLRRIGIAADAVCDERHIISQPEWEEADIEVPRDHYESLEPLAVERGWSRPEWVLPVYDPLALRRFKGEYWIRYRWTLARALPVLHRRYRELSRAYAPIRDSVGSDFVFEDMLVAFHMAWFERLLVNRPLRPFFAQYDVVQAYATHPIHSLVLGAIRPCIAFEHGTLRELPFAGNAVGRLLSLSYRLADKVLITNADVISSVKRLGLENYLHIPHPVDETRYEPGPSMLRVDLEARGYDFVVFLPSRHDWIEKGTDRGIEAFARLVREGPRRPVLVLTEWGKELDRSHALIRQLGIEDAVVWKQPLPKLKLLDAYRAADVVFDQFLIGTFGGIAPEAMACAIPVIMGFDESVHRWCFPELPPILQAETTDEIYAYLRLCATDEGVRQRIGDAGRTWMRRHHSWRLVAERQKAVYEEVLGN
jgi:glycosyltransferase involved in cell wall biosynthesis